MHANIGINAIINSMALIEHDAQIEITATYPLERVLTVM